MLIAIVIIDVVVVALLVWNGVRLKRAFTRHRELEQRLEQLEREVGH